MSQIGIHKLAFVSSYIVSTFTYSFFFINSCTQLYLFASIFGY